MSQATKKIVFWILALLALSVVLLIALNTFATRIINQKSVKNRIEAAVSQALGGQFKYERAHLSLLLHPRLVLQDLSLSMPKGLSGNMKTLDIYPALWPLSTGKFRLVKVLLDHPDIHLALTGKNDNSAAMETWIGPSLEKNLVTVLGFMSSRMPGVAIFIEQGRLTFDQANRPFFTLQDIESRIGFASTGPDAQESSEASPEKDFRMIANVQCIITEAEQLPGPVRIAITRLELFPMKISILDTRIQVLDTLFSISGSLDDYLTLTPRTDLTINGTAGPKTIQWIRTAVSLPSEPTVHAPVTVSQAHLSWNRGGTTRLEGAASVQDSLSLLFDMSWGLDHLAIKDLRIRDQTSQAALSLDLEKKVLNFAFSGNLAQSSLNLLFEHEKFRFGWVRGDFRAQVVLDRPMESKIRGTIEGEQLIFPFQLNTPVILNRVSLKAVDRTVTLNPVVLTLGDKHHTVRGKITASVDKWLMDLATDGLEWESLQLLFAPNTAHDQPVTQGPRQVPVRADIRLSTSYFSAGRWTVSPARAEIMLGVDGIRISLKEAVVCGVNLPGMVTFKSTEISFDLKPAASHQDLKSSLFCLTGEENRIMGTFDLSGHLMATGEGQTLLNTLQGNMAFTAKDGRMFGDSVIVRTLMFLNVTDLLRGNYPNPGEDGVPYKSLSLRGTIQKGVVSLGEAVLTSPVIHLAGRGSLNLLDRTMDITVLAAPFTTTDAVIKKIPLVRDILGNSLVTFPIRISGQIENPKFESIPPSAVAEGLVDMMERTLGLPFKVIEPIIPNRKTR